MVNPIRVLLSHASGKSCTTFSTKIKQVFSLSFFLIGFTGLIQAATPAPASNALPTNGQVVAGNVSINSTSSANNVVMNINQTSQRAVINWDSFNVGKNATVNFNQPNANAVILNRVTGATASMINGAINANGQVVLVNSNGVVFGRGAEVNAAAVVASTLNIANQDFMDGKNIFKDDGTGQGSKAGQIINKGMIQGNKANGEGGFIALLAPEVRNSGVLLAQKGGAVAIGSGNQITLTIQGQSLLAIKVDEAAYNGLISNKHIIEAPGGLVVLATSAANQLMAGVIKNTGRISANALVNNGGTIELVAKNVTQAGTLSSNSQTQAGGQINIIGQEIAVAKGSSTIATGATAGGQVNIGLSNTQVSGGTQVNNPTQAGIKANADLASSKGQLAKTVTIEESTFIDTSATQAGNGGAIAIWSELKTTVAGILKSMGGVLSGNGGFIETSSKGTVSLASTVSINTGANSATGKAGTWLLDPIDLTIDSAAAGVISSVLSSSNVTIAVTNSTSSCPGLGVCNASVVPKLTIAANIEKTGSLYTKLVLSSAGEFYLNDNISITGKNLDVIISSSIAFLNVGSLINASTVTVQAQTSIWSDGSIQASNYLFGGSADVLGNAIKLLAQAIYVSGAIRLNSSQPADPPFRIVGANINAIVDTNLDKVYSSTAANDPNALIVTAATQADSNVIYLTASQIDPNNPAIVDIKSTAQVLANGTNGGSVYLRGTNVYTRIGSFLQANGSPGSGGMIGIHADAITISGEVFAGGFVNGGSINLIADTATLNLRDGVIRANGMTGSSGTMNAYVSAAASFTAANNPPNSSFDLNNALFITQNIYTAVSGAVNLGYDIRTAFGSTVTLGTGAYANLAISGTPTYYSGTSIITNSVGAGSYSNLVVKGLSLSGADSGRFLLVTMPSMLTVTAAPTLVSATQPVVSATQSVSTTQSVATVIRTPPPPPPLVIFNATLPAPAPAKLQVAPSIAPMVAPAAPVPANTPPAGGEVTMQAPAKALPLTVMADGSIQLTPPPPPGTAPAVNTSANQAPTPAAPPPAASRAGSAKESREVRNASKNSEMRKNSNIKDGIEKAETKDRSGKAANGQTKYVSKYANGFKNTDKSAPKAVADKALASNKPSANREGKYDSRLRAMNNNPAVIAAMKQNPFSGTISPFPAGVPHVEVTPLVLRGGDSLAQSYDDVPSIRNSGVANVARSRNSENFHQSLESVNLMSTLSLFILH